MKMKWGGIVFIVLAIYFALFSSLQAAEPLSDTGQTKCFDESGVEINPCPAPGTAFYGQDAHYSRDRSYTKLDSDDNNLSNLTTNWSMVRDNVTGLIWEVKQSRDGVKNYDNPHDTDNTYTWYSTGIGGTPGDSTDTEDFINSLNTGSGFCGHTDWRLPTIKELSRLTDLNRYHPSIDITFFPRVVLNDYYCEYWSSTCHALYGASQAWIVDFENAGANCLLGTMGSFHVRAVRSEQ